MTAAGGRRPGPLAAVLAAVVAGTLFVSLVARPYRVRGASMEPALRDGDVVVTLVAPGVRRLVDAGDVVVARLPDGTVAIKRVVAAPDRGRVVLAGDNLGRSRDSRAYGPLPDAAIRGLVLGRLYPPPFALDPGAAVEPARGDAVPEGR